MTGKDGERPPCTICNQPYHRYCPADPEHEFNAMGCVNSLLATLSDEQEAHAATKRVLELTREMVDLLTEAERSSLVFLSVHGWHTDPALVQRGQEIRAELAATQATAHKSE